MGEALIVEYKGVAKSITAWAKEYGLTSGALYYRIQQKWPMEKALHTPMLPKAKTYEYKGRMYTAAELAKINGQITASTMHQRLDSGMTVEEAVELPNRRGQRKKRITEKEQKRIFQPIVKQRDTRQCRTCQYREKDLTCGYQAVTGHCRLLISKPSPNCTVYVKGDSIVQKEMLKRLKKGVIM